MYYINTRTHSVFWKFNSFQKINQMIVSIVLLLLSSVDGCSPLFEVKLRFYHWYVSSACDVAGNLVGSLKYYVSGHLYYDIIWDQYTLRLDRYHMFHIHTFLASEYNHSNDNASKNRMCRWVRGGPKKKNRSDTITTAKRWKTMKRMRKCRARRQPNAKKKKKQTTEWHRKSKYSKRKGSWCMDVWMDGWQRRDKTRWKWSANDNRIFCMRVLYIYRLPASQYTNQLSHRRPNTVSTLTLACCSRARFISFAISYNMYCCVAALHCTMGIFIEYLILIGIWHAAFVTPVSISYM